MKLIVTPKRVTLVTALVFIFCFCTVTPVYVISRLDTKYSSHRNRSVFGLVFTKDREYVERISFIINNFATPFIAFVIIVICTVILSYKLRDSTKWRDIAVKSSKDDRVTNRNLKVAKMVVLISVIFIVCFVPNTISMLAVACILDLFLEGQYLNISIILGGLGYTLESLNSSVNIFIYYNMSSKYQNYLRGICWSKKTKIDSYGHVHEHYKLNLL
jgi:hypothetical protein